ncbi:Alpha/Beta hydrolase protein [Cladochytrium replicatum]|nr:Alpha/Beta hydrolase protein [Cladochytrium replicatum]
MKFSLAAILAVQSLIIATVANPLPQAESTTASVVDETPVERYSTPRTSHVYTIEEIVASYNETDSVLARADSNLGPYASKWGFSGNNYPIVMVYGLLGWGEPKLLGLFNQWGGIAGSLVKVLQDKGYTILQPSLAPASSNWERACEVYAHLTGTVVDYGIARAKKFGHQRFGKDFRGKALYPDWGKAGKKVHFIGQSMGGPTIQMLIAILNQGSAEEIAAAEAAGVPASPLFYTNKTASQFVGGMFSISGTLQGTQCVEIIDNFAGFIIDLVKVIGGISDLSDVDGLLWDFQLDHWGLAYKKGESLKSYFDRIFNSAFWAGKSNAAYDLSIQGNRDPNIYQNVAQPNSGVYYFSVPTSMTKQVLNIEVAPIGSNIFLAPFANAMGTYNNKTMFGDDSASWRDNDGLVPVKSSASDRNGYISYSMDLRASNLVVPSKKPTTGKYHNTGIVELDHINVIGLLDVLSILHLSSFFTNMAKILLSLPA